MKFGYIPSWWWFWFWSSKRLPCLLNGVGGTSMKKRFYGLKLWGVFIRKIPSSYNWHTAGKDCNRLRSPRISIFRLWLEVEVLANFKLDNGTRIACWLDSFVGLVFFKVSNPKLYKITLLSKGLVFDHWDLNISSWLILFHRFLKEDEILDFESFFGQILRRVFESIHWRLWTLEGSGTSYLS